jgi:hypothetical protein
VRMEIPVHDPAEAEQWKFVAEAALSWEQVRKYLYVLKKETKDDGTAHDVISRIDVEVGQSKNGLIAVKGLKGDERVVVNNLQRVRPKMEIPADKQNLVPMPRANVPSTKTPVAAMPGSG